MPGIDPDVVSCVVPSGKPSANSQSCWCKTTYLDIYHYAFARLRPGIRENQMCDEELIKSLADSDEITVLLNELDLTMVIQLNRWSSGSIQGHWSQFLPLGRPRVHKWEDSFLSFAVSMKLYQYIEATCSDSSVFEKTGRPLLNYAISPLPGSTSDVANLEAVVLLSIRDVDPNEVFGGETVWRRFLQTYYKFEAQTGDSDSAYSLRWIRERFLQKGADRQIAYQMAFAGERARHGTPLPALQPE